MAKVTAKVIAKIQLLCVGKLQDPHLIQLEQEYLKRLNRYRLQIQETRTAPTREQEGDQMEDKISQLLPGPVFLLAENGKTFASSEAFAQFLQPLISLPRPPIFVIGGASGHGPAVLSLSHTAISLSPLTFPHQWARVLFIEQVYRAQCIDLGHPYHRS